jgi:hypothetical protein
MKKFSIIHIPPLSFYSKELYRDLAMNWRGVNFLYLFLLLAVCWIPITMRVNKFIGQFVNEEAPKILKEVPDITITNGEVSIKEPQPYYIKGPDSNNVVAIIDTTGTINSLEKTGAYCLLTKNKLIIKQSKVETREYSLSQVKNFVLTGDHAMKWLHIIKKLAVVVLFPIVVGGSFIYRIIQALIYGAIGMLFASGCKVKLPYSALVRMAVVAVTPCIIISTVLLSAGVRLPFASLIYLLLSLGYLFFGVQAVSQTMPPEQEGISS